MIDDEPLTLSSHALAALAEFHAEQEEQIRQFEQLRSKTAGDDDDDDEEPLSMAAFMEDWNESQFWYSDETALILADQLLEGATADTTIGLLSTPSILVALKNRLKQTRRDRKDIPRLVLFEFDDRFNVFSEFVHYDYREPLNLPVKMKGSFDRLIIDPPFLNNDCHTKFALSARWLLKPQQPSTPPSPSQRVIVCTGERMKTIVQKLYRSLGVRTTTFEPHHGELANQFYCYANFECPSWQWRSET